ncbi:MAG: outer membrane beta-barrel protein [Bacteroidales bacterium]|nr:outer membrane beta-barrel protein [Bacteroidales bacterium]
MDKFDLSVKAILESGEEQVPPRVWEAVSARVPAGRRAAAPWWRVAGLSLAAAALAVVVVFSGLFRHDSGSAVSEGPVLAELSEPAVSDDPSLRGEGSDNTGTQSLLPGDGGNVRSSSSSHRPSAGPPAYEPRVATHSAVTRQSGTVASGMTASIVPDEAQPADGMAALGCEREGPASEASGKDEREARTDQRAAPRRDGRRTKDRRNGERVSEPDPFAALAYEDARARAKAKSGRTAIVLTGLMGSNDGSAQGIHALKIMSTGAYTPKSASGIFESSESVFSVPVSVGVGVKFPIAGKLSFGTGVTYSLLERSFSGTYIKDGVNIATNADIRHSLRYIGIPLNLYYDMWHEYGFNMYAFAGGQIEKGISNKYYISTTPDDIVLNQKVQGLQYSVAAGLGMQYDVSRTVALYLDPGVRFYFDSGQPKSIRTKKPLMFAFEAGVRFNL